MHEELTIDVDEYINEHSELDYEINLEDLEIDDKTFPTNNSQCNCRLCKCTKRSTTNDV